MPEPTGSPATNPPVLEPNKELSTIMESITKLSEAVSSAVEKIDSFEEQIDEIAQAQITPEKPVEPKPKWKPEVWDEFPEMAKQVAKETFEKIEKERATIEEAEIKKGQELQTQIDTDFNNQLEMLEKKGLIPEVKSVDDPDDLGKKIRKELFAIGIKYDSPNLVAMAGLREERMQDGYTFDMETSKWIKSNPAPFGANAPVGSSSRSAGTKAGPTYKEIHGLSMDEMIRRYNA